MITKFIAETEAEAMMLLNAERMSMMLWELKHNFWRQWKHDESKLSITSLNEAIENLFEEHQINIDYTNNNT